MKIWKSSAAFILCIPFLINIKSVYIGSVGRFVEEGKPLSIPFNITFPIVNRKDVQLMLFFKNVTYFLPITFDLSINIVTFKSEKALLNMTGKYFCQYLNNSCGFIDIEVGRLPQVPKIDCTSINFEKMTCCFTPNPKQILANTKFISKDASQFFFHVRYSRGMKWSDIDVMIDDSCKYWPKMVLSPELSVRVEVGNILGSHSTQHNYSHNDILRIDRPLPVSNLVLKSDENAVSLQWGHDGYNIVGYKYLIMCNSNYPISLTYNSNTSKTSVQMGDWPPYSNVTCSVKVWHKPETSLPSDPTSDTIWTPESIPNYSPILGPGILKFDKKSGVFNIYFQLPKPIDRNGVITQFCVKCPFSEEWANISKSERSHKCKWKWMASSQTTSKRSFEIKVCTKIGCQTNQTSLIIEPFKSSDLNNVDLWISKTSKKHKFNFLWRLPCYSKGLTVELYLVHCQMSDLDSDCSEIEIDYLGIFNKTDGFVTRLITNPDSYRYALVERHGSQISPIDSWTNTDIDFRQLQDSLVLKNAFQKKSNCYKSWNCRVVFPFTSIRNLPFQSITFTFLLAEHVNITKSVDLSCLSDNDIYIIIDGPNWLWRQGILFATYEHLTDIISEPIFVTDFNVTIIPCLEIFVVFVACIVLVAISLYYCYKHKRKKKQNENKVNDIRNMKEIEPLITPAVFSNKTSETKVKEEGLYSISTVNHSNNSTQLNQSTGYVQRPPTSSTLSIEYESIALKPTESLLENAIST